MAPLAALEGDAPLAQREEEVLAGQSGAGGLHPSGVVGMDEGAERVGQLLGVRLEDRHAR